MDTIRGLHYIFGNDSALPGMFASSIQARSERGNCARFLCFPCTRMLLRVAFSSNVLPERITSYYNVAKNGRFFTITHPIFIKKYFGFIVPAANIFRTKFS